MLNPDATGTYQRIADVAGYTAARRLDDAYTIYYDENDLNYYLIAGTVIPPSPLTNGWFRWAPGTPIDGRYQPLGTYTGTATFAWN